jgi:hypothetical protein
MPPVQVRIGPIRRDWPHAPSSGDCLECGGECDGGECGLHRAGCVYGGFTPDTCYWLIVNGCSLYHGEVKEA